MKKIFMITSIFILLVIGINLNVQAAANDYTWTGYDMTSLDEVEGASGAGVVKSTKNVVGTIIQVIRVVGTGIAIIMITYVAIKYMSAAPEEKAEFKKSATAFIVGAIVLFGASNILAVIANFASANI